MSPVYCILSYQKITKIVDKGICSLWLAAIFCQNVYLTVRIPLHQNHICADLLPYLFGAAPQNCLIGCPLGYNIHFAPSET